jgi:hypothetical protein
MRQWAALGVGLLTWLLVGCTAGKAVHSAAWRKGQPGLPAPDVSGTVQMEIALLDCPVGDPFINNDLWALADEQVVAPEHKAALEDNGFRVAQLGGLLPDELQELLSSKRSNANPRSRQVLKGHPAALNLGTTVPECRFELIKDGEPGEMSLEQARCQLVVVPEITADGKACLHFTPQVEYGEQIPHFHPAEDGSGWIYEYDLPRKTFPALGWDVTLAPNQYLVVGARFDRRRSLGFASFVQTDGDNTVQRVLVIRVSRAGTPPALGGDGESGEEVCAKGPAALAIQAPPPTARGSRP